MRPVEGMRSRSCRGAMIRLVQLMYGLLRKRRDKHDWVSKLQFALRGSLLRQDVAAAKAFGRESVAVVVLVARKFVRGCPKA